MLQIPRFAFEKFPGSKAELSTQMKSVGEAMAIGRTFQESFQKALRSLETGLDGWSLPKNWKRKTEQQLIYGLRVPNPDRMVVLKQVGTRMDAWQCTCMRQSMLQNSSLPYVMLQVCTCMLGLVLVLMLGPGIGLVPCPLPVMQQGA